MRSDFYEVVSRHPYKFPSMPPEATYFDAFEIILTLDFMEGMSLKKLTGTGGQTIPAELAEELKRL